MAVPSIISANLIRVIYISYLVNLCVAFYLGCYTNSIDFYFEVVGSRWCVGYYGLVFGWIYLYFPSFWYWVYLNNQFSGLYGGVWDIVRKNQKSNSWWFLSLC